MAVALAADSNAPAPTSKSLLAKQSASDPDVLALALAPVKGINGNESEQTNAGEKFRRLIDPIVNAERYPEMHRRFQSKGALLEHIARENGISVRTLRRKLERWEEKAINGLTRRIRSDKGQPRALNTASVNYIISAACPKPGSYGEYSNADIWKAHEEERVWRAAHVGKVLAPTDRAAYPGYLDTEGRLLPAAQLSEASYATFCRQIAKIPQLVKLMARRGEDAYRNAELISFRDYASIQPLDYVVMDHRVLDIFCLVRDRGGWKLARPWLTAAIDMRTRKWLAWCIVETPSSDSIATVLKKVFVHFGLPRSLYWDNGKDFRCQWLEGHHERSRTAGAIDGLPSKWTGVLESLGIRVHHAIVKNARAKLIEPNFGRVSDFDHTLDEWCGHKVGARPERFEALLKEHEAWLSGKREVPAFRTIEQVAELYTHVLEDLNEQPLQGEGMRKVTPTGMGWWCPNEAWEILIPRVQRRTVPEDVLQLCFAKRRELTVHNGEIQATFDSRPYHYRLSGNRMALLGLNGRKVELAYDPLDLGKAAVYYENAFIGLAECMPLRRMGEAEFVQDERDRRRARREVKRFIAAVHKSVPVADPETRLARRREVLPARTPADRPEVAVQLPAAIAAAHAAQLEETEFSFAATSEALPVVEQPAREEEEFDFFASVPETKREIEDGEDTFRFFQGE